MFKYPRFREQDESHPDFIFPYKLFNPYMTEAVIV